MNEVCVKVDESGTGKIKQLIVLIVNVPIK